VSREIKKLENFFSQTSIHINAALVLLQAKMHICSIKTPAHGERKIGRREKKCPVKST